MATTPESDAPAGRWPALAATAVGSMPGADVREATSVVLGELEFGAEKSTWAARNRQRLNELTERLPLLGVDASAARHYARIRAQLERQGQPIGANDLWIAAQALAADATLVTDNEGEFRRVPGLALENWLRDEA